MHTDSTGVLCSATDLANHLGCRHLSELDHLVVHGLIDKPDWSDPNLDVLQERGLRHERAYAEQLRAEGLQIADLSEQEGEDAFARTEAAMREGAEVIVQAALRHGRWMGYADILRRVERASDLGAWSYDVADTKLSQETRGGTVLQLCLYADLIGAIQGAPSWELHVVKPGDGFPTDTYLFDEHAAYYRWVRAQLEAFLERRDGVLADVGGEPTEHLDLYPEPVTHCEVCRWWSRCDRRRRGDDHLSYVAGLGKLHTKELRRQGTVTLEGFATQPEPLGEAPLRGRRETYANLQEQARIQLSGRLSGASEHELLPFETEKGLARLPAPSLGDIYLDFEGDPFVEGGGLEYLLGFVYREADGAMTYVGHWADGPDTEKAAFAAFMRFVGDRLKEHPDLHIHHYHHYEESALKRLASRHACFERELDVLLRGGRLIDQHKVVREALRASVEAYSIKALEAFSGYEREVDLKEEASPALRRVARALELGVPEDITDEDRRQVEGYNRDDCLSLAAMQEWLEELREAAIADGAELPRPPLQEGAASEHAEERAAEVQEVYDALVDGVPEHPAERTAEQACRWLLAHLIEYFHRENRVGWWEYFARKDAEPEERWKDRKILMGLEFDADLGAAGRARVPTHRYRFPPQDVSLGEGDELFNLDALEDDDKKIGTVARFDPVQGVLELKMTGATVDERPTCLHAKEDVPTRPIAGSLLDVCRAVAQHGLGAHDAPFPAARRLLLRTPPLDVSSASTPTVGDKSTGSVNGPLRADGESALDAGLRITRALDGGVLAIQGPPGTGKTYNGARMIVGLVQDGQHIGVTATSHKVIRNLLQDVVQAAREQQVRIRVVHKISSRNPPPDPVDGIEDIASNDAFDAAVAAGAVAGGVAWTWARDDFVGTLDHLFVDEAGQMSLAHVLCTTRATRNLIMLGDPLQLQQPQRGAHPEGAEISALDHLLGEHKTMPEWLGLFLEQTWRLPPSICQFTSEVFYESRLEPRDVNERQRLVGGTRFAGEGLFVVPVPHEGNASASDEEVDVVERIVADLLGTSTSWIDVEQADKPLTADDILVVAPYNAQVAALSRRMPALDIGTVDRFQGQERPVVLYSMASSSPEDAPRGLSFLYDLHRMNVATSRARCVCILVASPALFGPECATPEQIRQASGLCSYRERAQVVEMG